MSKIEVAFDADGLLCPAPFPLTMLALLLRLYKTPHKPKEGKKKETNSVVNRTLHNALRPLRPLNDLWHYIRPMDGRVLNNIATFKDKQEGLGNEVITSVVSGRSERLKDQTTQKIAEAGYPHLFNGEINLRPDGYSSPGWKSHRAKLNPNGADIYCHIDDDLKAAHQAALEAPKSQVYLVGYGGLMTNGTLYRWNKIECPPNLHLVGSVAQALAAIANLSVKP